MVGPIIYLSIYLSIVIVKDQPKYNHHPTIIYQLYLEYLYDGQSNQPTMVYQLY
jgi:hypothetical protein